MRKYLLDGIILILLASILFQGAKNQFQKQDLREYQCYALAFWQGNQQLDKFPAFCHYYIQTTPKYSSLHYLPNEYPLFSIAPFSLGLVSIFSQPYEQSFCIWMIIFASCVYILLRKFVSQTAAAYYAITIVIAGWSTVAARFDIIPALLTLIAILLAQEKKWIPAMILLALSVCLKLYPILIFPIFIISLFKEKKTAKVLPILSFFITCSIILAATIGLNANKTIAPLTYLRNRPFQIESIWSSILWSLQSLGVKEQVIFSYGSLNINSKFSPIILPVATILSIFAPLTIYFLQIKNKYSLTVASILVITASLITAKVLSPQYLIWLIPLIPLLKQHPKEIKIVWIIICLLTLLIFPFAYNNQSNLFSWKPDAILQLTIAIRNILLIYFTIRLFYTQQNIRETP